MNKLTIECPIHLTRRGCGRQELVVGPKPQPDVVEPGRVPRVARLAALALRFEGLVRSGAVKDYAELARLGHVTRARMSQIMNLLNLAPDILEAVLLLPRTERGRDRIQIRHLQPIASTLDWSKQRRQWRELCRHQGAPVQS